MSARAARERVLRVSGAAIVKALATALISCFLLVAPSSSAADNGKLKQLYEEDQSDRRPGPDEIDWVIIGPRDNERRKTVLEIVASGGLATANDYYHAAMVFQHGRTAEDMALAYSLATVAWRVDPAHPKARWLTASAWDRLLMRKKKPQWYGTQFVRNNDSGKWELYQTDEDAVSDRERERMGVPPLSAAKEHATLLNRK